MGNTMHNLWVDFIGFDKGTVLVVLAIPVPRYRANVQTLRLPVANSSFLTVLLYLLRKIAYQHFVVLALS